MKRIENIISAVSPSWGASRLRSKLMSDAMVKASKIDRKHRAYDGAAQGTSMQGWELAGSSGPNAEVMGGLSTLVPRSHDLIRNNPLAANAQRIWTEGMIGTGLTGEVVVGSGNKARLAKSRSDLWEAWANNPRECDFYGRLTFNAIQSVVADAWFAGGQVIVLRRRVTDNTTVPFRIQVLEGVYLDDKKQGDEGQNIVQGVQFDATGRIEGYWLHKSHPGDGSLTPLFSSRSFSDSVFIERSEVLHIFSPGRPGQIQGVPRLAPAMLTMKDLDNWNYAKMKQQEIASCFAAFVTGLDTTGVDTGNPALPVDDLIDRMEPGMINYVGLDRKIDFSSPPNADKGIDFAKMQMHNIAAAIGVTYEDLTTDNNDVTFISGRIGRIRQNKVIKRERATTFIPQFADGVWRWFEETAIIVGSGVGVTTMRWIHPVPEITDPQKEGDALNDDVRRGFIGPKDAIRAKGGNPDKVIEQFKEWNKTLDDAEVILDSDPRHISGAGQKQDFNEEPGPNPVVEQDDERKIFSDGKHLWECTPGGDSDFRCLGEVDES